MSILIISSCNNKTTLLISPIIHDPSCSPPCWQNIVPQKTTRDEVDQLLKAISWVDVDTVKVMSGVSPNDSFTWKGKSNAGDYSGRVYVDGNFVSIITFSPREGLLTINEIINELGEPQNVLAVCSRGEKSIMSVFFLYPKYGYGFLDYYPSDYCSEKAIQIKPDEYVKQVWYCDMAHYFDYLTAGQISNLDISIIENGIQIWAGFEEYSFIIR